MTEETLSATPSGSDTRQTPVLKFDHQSFTASEFFKYVRLSFNWSIVQQAVKHKILELAFRENEIGATDAEVMKGLEKFRLERKLLTSEATSNWLHHHGLSPEDLYEICQFEVNLSKLKEKLFGEEVIRKHFAFHRTQFEKVELYQIVTKKEEKAKEIAALLKDKNCFFDLAKFQSEDEATARLCGYMGLQKRNELVAEIESKIFAAKEGSMVGPIKALKRFQFFYIEKFYPPAFDEATQIAIREQLFGEWLAHKANHSNLEILV